jgi:asparagine synthase (glutamine-hydrolysing)
VCGIAGLIGPAASRERLERMADAIRHRGPDDAGVYLDEVAGVGLAHRRLSIIDLSAAGRQPMADQSNRFWITFNGEIYNFQEMRDELVAEGFTFRTRTDTEVILAAYAKWGTDCLSRFNGMFAIGLYDRTEGRLLLARDRMGKKPLFIAERETEVAFASELQALRASGIEMGPLEPRALNSYLSCGYIPGSWTIYKHVRKVPPGHAVLLDLERGTRREWAYWQPPDKRPVRMTEVEAVEEIDRRLREAVRCRMVADVPLGAFLSGGLDSSLVVAMMQESSAAPVKTFTIGFGEAAYDESRYARIVAQHFGTDHHEFQIRPDFLSILPELVRHVGEPFADSSILPTYYVCRETRREVTVALSGDGGDELFAGYRTYVGSLPISYADRYLPMPIRRAGAKAAAVLPRGLKGRAQLARLDLHPDEAFVQGYSFPFFNPVQRRQLLNPEVLDSLDGALDEPEEYRKSWMQQRGQDFIERMTFSDLKVYMPDDILVKVDRASMAVSLEVRCPFLDPAVVEFSLAQLPSRFKLRAGLVKKYVLKRLARLRLPRELPIHRKQGFGLPVCEWLRGPWVDFARDMLASLDPALLSRSYAEEMFRRHLARQSDESYRIFALMTLSLWSQDQRDGGANSTSSAQVGSLSGAR